MGSDLRGIVDESVDPVELVITLLLLGPYKLSLLHVPALLHVLQQQQPSGQARLLP